MPTLMSIQGALIKPLVVLCPSLNQWLELCIEGRRPFLQKFRNAAFREGLSDACRRRADAEP